MEDKKSSKAIGVQRFIPVVPCSSQLNYSIRSCAFQAKRSPEVPNLSFRLLLFKHKALLSSASLFLSLYAAFCAGSQALCSISDELCSLLLLPSFPLAWSQLHPFQTGSPFPQHRSLKCLLLFRPCWYHQLEEPPLSASSLVISPSRVTPALSMFTQVLLQMGLHPQLGFLSPHTTVVAALHPPRPLCLLSFLSPIQCHCLVPLQTNKYKFRFLKYY